MSFKLKLVEKAVFEFFLQLLKKKYRLNFGCSEFVYTCISYGY